MLIRNWLSGLTSRPATRGNLRRSRSRTVSAQATTETLEGRLLLSAAAIPVLRTVQISHESNGGPTLADGAGFGSALTRIGDVDGEGVDDLAVGTPGTRDVFVTF
jgi:hypothetical protein